MIKNKVKELKAAKKHNYLLRQLIEAVIQNDLYTVEQLLKQGATINGKDAFNTSPLEYAVRSANVEMIQYLIQAGADIDITDDDNYTCLMRAIQIFSYSIGFPIVKTLLKNGCDVAHMGKGGASALYLAHRYEPRYIGLLKRYGAMF